MLSVLGALDVRCVWGIAGLREVKCVWIVAGGDVLGVCFCMAE